MSKRTIIMTAFLILSFPLIIMAQTDSEATDSPLYWEQRGLEDGKSSLALKTVSAGIGGCLFGGIGGLIATPTALTGGAGGSLGCLAGWGLGSLAQQEPAIPFSASLTCQDAYTRGYKKGKAKANTTALLVGSGTTLVAIVATALVWTSYYYY